MIDARRPARWPWFAIALFALIEPLTHVWLKYGLVGETAHSGLRIGDTPFFLAAMGIFTNDFFSPYAACASSGGVHNPWLYALPHHWLYGAIGWTARLLHIDPFVALGLASGLGAAFYLWMTLRFLRYVMPQRADFIFALFCFAGGLGGVLWLATLTLGYQAQPEFEAWFHRFARYELIEGPFLSPVLVFPRIYYTLPLGTGLAALMALMGSLGRENAIPGKRAILLQFICTVLNARVGLLFWGVMLCFMVAQPLVRAGIKWRYAFYMLLPTLGASLLVYLAFRMNMEGAENVSELLRRSAWAGSLLTATIWLWPPALLAAGHHLTRMGWLPRLITGCCLGYGASFFALYCAHQLWYGNLSGGGETAAAIAVSDWALLGIPLGFCALGIQRRGASDDAPECWITLWCLGLTCVSVAAVGQGWFLRFMPERGLALLGLPLAILAAEGLGMARARLPKLTMAYTALLFLCGAASLGVSTLAFQGPLGYRVGQSPFGWVHSEVVRSEDAKLIDRLSEGRVLAPASPPPLLGDVAVARRPGLTTVFGQPSLEFGDVDMMMAAREVQQFFSPRATDEFRTWFVFDWCVDFILCPATHPVDPAVLEQLSALPWLEKIGEEGDAVLFRVLVNTRSPSHV